MTDKIIMDLCSGTGPWSRPYREAGYEVIEVEILKGKDVILMEYEGLNVTGILMAPPCDHFAVSGARWWKKKGPEALKSGLSLVDACLRQVVLHEPDWWMLENPVGRLVHYLGKPTLYFNPWEYAGWSDDPLSNAYTKKTCIWGKFTIPERKPVDPIDGSKMHKLFSWDKTEDGFKQRAITPEGFSRAVLDANRMVVRPRISDGFVEAFFNVNK